ncbi:MAG: hypothetical protein AB1489_21515 [Acidobacteriota bacterium]
MSDNSISTTSHTFGCARCTAIPKTPFQLVRTLLKDVHEDYTLDQCVDCGQIYLQHCKEIGRFDGEDDLWTRWVPLTSQERDRIEELFPLEGENWEKVSILNEFLHNRRRLVKHPYGKYYWTDEPNDACDLVRPGW